MPENSSPRREDGAANLASVQMPPHIRKMLGEPPLLSTDDRATYEALESAFAQIFKPTDIRGWIRVRDAAHQTWQIRRFRRAESDVVKVGFKAGLTSVLNSTPSHPLAVKDLVEQFFGTPSERAEVVAELNRCGFGFGAVISEAIVGRERQTSSIRKLIFQTERSLNSTFREADKDLERRAEYLETAPEDLAEQDVPGIVPKEPADK